MESASLPIGLVFSFDEDFDSQPIVERRPMGVVPGPRERLAFAAIVFDLVSPRGLPNKLLFGLAAPALPKQ